MTVPNAATPSALLASLLAQLPAAISATISTSTRGGYLYEAYLFGVVLRASRLAGFSVAFEDRDGVASVLRLRGAPGRLPIPGDPGMRWTHAVLSCPERPALEVHTAVSVVGKSKVVHEADVLMLPQVDLDPRGSDAELTIEAKYYTDAVGLGEGREFLGLSSDVNARNKMFVATLAGNSVVSLFAGQRPVVQYDIGVLPGRNGEASLLGIVQRVLRNYRSSRRLARCIRPPVRTNAGAPETSLLARYAGTSFAGCWRALRRRRRRRLAARTLGKSPAARGWRPAWCSSA